MKTTEELEAELEELKKEFYFFSKNGGSGSSSGDNNGNQTTKPSEDNEWTVLYDKDSDDPAINLGYPNGLFSGTGALRGITNVDRFKVIRFYFHLTTCLQHFDLDVPDGFNNQVHFLTHRGSPTDLVSCNNYIYFENGIPVIYIGAIYRLIIYTSGNKFPTRTNCANEEDTCFYRILAK